MPYKDMDQARAYMRNLVADRKRLGICVRCGKEMAFIPYSQCPACLERGAQKSIKWRQKVRQDMALAGSLRERNRASYAAKKASGICVSCGKRKAASGKARCETCLGKRRERNTQCTWERRERRKAAGVCTTCGRAKPAPNYFECQSCLDLKKQNDRLRRRASWLLGETRAERMARARDKARQTRGWRPSDPSQKEKRMAVAADERLAGI